MAMIPHPLFKDWDMIAEMKSFCLKVYGKTITNKDAERILKCFRPA